jgi:hypothetical protein
MTQEPLVTGDVTVTATSQDPAQAGEQEKKGAQTTEYHILALTGTAGAKETYEVRARNVKASSAKDAIKNTVTPIEAPVSFIAIPSRSFKLHTVRLQTTHQTVIE